MSEERSPALPVRVGGNVSIATYGASMELPALVADAGQRAAEASFEFFTARIPNAHTRDAYGRAFRRFAAWCAGGELPLHGITPPAVASYLATLEREGLSDASRRLHLAALRHWMDWLCQKGVLPFNPAASVRGPKLVVREGKTPVLERDDAIRLFDSIKGTDAVSLRDRAVLSVMLYGFVRVSAACKLCVKDFEDREDAWLLLHEKGAQVRRVPAHRQVRDAIRAYLIAAGLREPDADPRARSDSAKAPLFQTARGRSGEVSGKAMRRTDVLAMVKRRCVDAALPSSTCSHSFRATGITIHQENGGRLEDAQALAGHADMRTTQLYNRKRRKLQHAEVDRVQL